MTRSISGPLKYSVALATLAVVGLGGWTIYTTATPSVRFSDKSVTLGKVRRGEVVTVAYLYEDTGPVAAAVDVESTSCGTTAMVEKPGPNPRSGQVRIETDTRYLADGTHTKFVTLRTNDPANRSIKLAASFELFSEIVLDRAMVDFGDVDAGAAATALIDLRVASEGGVAVIGVTMEGPAIFGARLIRSSDTVMRLGIDLYGTRTKGPHFATAVITTSSSALGQIRVPVRAHVRGTE